ncbi:hypothetical protein Tco_1430961 [Tanacetum coccineum]
MVKASQSHASSTSKRATPDTSDTLYSHAGNPTPSHWSIMRVSNLMDEKMRIKRRLVPSCFAIFTFEPLTLSLTSMPSCDLECLTNILILCLILKASDQSLRKTLSLNLELS